MNRPRPGHRFAILRWALPTLLGWFAMQCGVLLAATVAIGNSRGYPGQESSVPFAVQQATNLVAAQFDVRYDDAKGSLTAPSLGTRNPSAVIRSREIAPGVHRMLVYSRNNAVLRTNGVAGRFSFTVGTAERVSSGPLTPIDPILVRSDGTRIQPTATASGKVFVTPIFHDPSGAFVDAFFPTDPDRQYVIQATEDFRTWINVSTNTAVGEFIEFLDHDIGQYPYRFYRTVRIDGSGASAIVAIGVNGNVVLQVQADSAGGADYVIEVSEDLKEWNGVGSKKSGETMVIQSGGSSAGNRQRFYRLRAR